MAVKGLAQLPGTLRDHALLFLDVGADSQARAASFKEAKRIIDTSIPGHLASFLAHPHCKSDSYFTRFQVPLLAKYAIDQGKSAMLSAIIDQAGTPNLQVTNPNHDFKVQPNKYQFSLLDYAISQGQVACAQILADHPDTYFTIVQAMRAEDKAVAIESPALLAISRIIQERCAARYMREAEKHFVPVR
jgi:hypothetical protein